MKQHEVDSVAKYLAEPKARLALEVVVRAARRRLRGKQPIMLFGDANDGYAALEEAKQFLTDVKAVDCSPKELTAHLACKLARIIGRKVTATSATHTVTVQPGQSGKEWELITDKLRDPVDAHYAHRWESHTRELFRLDTRFIAYVVQWLEAVADDTPHMTDENRDFIARRISVVTGGYRGDWKETYFGNDPNMMAEFIVRRALLLLHERKPFNGANPEENIPMKVAKWRELAAARNKKRAPPQETFMN